MYSALPGSARTREVCKPQQGPTLPLNPVNCVFTYSIEASVLHICTSCGMLPTLPWRG